MSAATVSFRENESLIDTEEPETEKMVLSQDKNVCVFNMRMQQPKEQLNDASAHKVVINVTIAVAVPGSASLAARPTMDSVSTRNSSSGTVDMLGALFHLEFDLLPGCAAREPSRTDINFCGSYAKVYPDRSESRVVPTWSDGEDIWVCFVQRFEVSISDAVARELCSHRMRLRLWDTRDKVAPKVRFDRPQPNRGAGGRQQSWVQQTVLTMSRLYGRSASGKQDSDRLLPHQLPPPPTVISSRARLLSRAAAGSVLRPPPPIVSIYASPKDSINSQLESYAVLEKLIESGDSGSGIQRRSVTAVVLERSRTFSVAREEPHQSQGQATAATTTEAPEYHSDGRTHLDVSVTDLFINDRTVSRSGICSSGSVEDVFCMVSLEEPLPTTTLLSADQIQRLNPLSIKIRSVSNLPCPSTELSHPVHCVYQFADLLPFQTLERRHNATIHFDDVKVIFLGDLDDVALRTQLLGSFLTVRLYDKAQKEEEKKHCGEARIDLSELVRKRLRVLNLLAPVVPVSQLLGAAAGTADGTADAGCTGYLESGTTIKLQLRVAEPAVLLQLTSTATRHSLVLVNSDPAGCTLISHDISALIVEHNCLQLGLPPCSHQLLDSHCLSDTDAGADLLTGFFIMDRAVQVLLVEGSATTVKLQLYPRISELLDTTSCSDRGRGCLKFFYDETTSFSQSGGYGLLSMVPLMLSRDLSFYVANSLLYVRDIVPRACVEGVCRLLQLTRTSTMVSVLRNRLIPDCDMIHAIAECLCTHLPRAAAGPHLTNAQYGAPVNSHAGSQFTAAVSGDKWRGEKKKAVVWRKTAPVKKQQSQRRAGTGFSYSCQTENVTERALAQLRAGMEPGRRYTYSQEYLWSGMVSPVDVELVYAQEERETRRAQRWKSAGCNSQSVIVTEARREELAEPWSGSELFNAETRPTLPERDQRNHHWDLLGQQQQSWRPIGAQLEDTWMGKRQQRETVVSSRLGPSSGMSTHRLLPATEDNWRRACQLDRLRGLRKDDKVAIKAISGRRYGDPNAVPALAMLLDCPAVATGFTVGGLGQRSLAVNYSVLETCTEPRLHTTHVPSKASCVYRPPFHSVIV